ncbi:MGMT family protein [Chungangia koreensis]|uniref:MGMT family protein n=1 Tax=Chungangia koreensis TaxID=752657 RepID=A0ABV8X791_9LACT
MQPFTLKVIEIIQAIPAGKVMTYGQVAQSAGSPRSARQVVRILHSMSGKYKLPWHRVINAKGEIALKDGEGGHEQRVLLESEGIVVSSEHKVDLTVYQLRGRELEDDRDWDTI